MRILHTSDWHLGKYLNEFSLLEDQRYILQKLGEVIENENIDVVIISGDIYHRAIAPADAVDLLDDVLNHFINNLKVSVLAIAGNHDSPQRLGFGSKLYESAGLYIQSVPDKKIKKVVLNDDFGEISFYLLPFLEPIKIRSMLKNTEIKTYQDAYNALFSLEINKIDKLKRNIVIAHSFFAGVSTEKNMEFSEGERNVGKSDMVSSEVFKDFDYTALGHLHSPQKVGNDNIRYAGSLLKYSLSEANQKKGFYIIDIKEKGNIQIEKRSIKPLRNLRVLKGSIENIIQNAKNDDSKLDYIFAQLDDNMIFDGMSKLRSVYPNVIGLSLRSENYIANETKIQMHDIKNNSMEELFEKFYFDMTNKDILEKELHIIKELSKKIESEV